MLRPFGFMKANTGSGGGDATFTEPFDGSGNVGDRDDWTPVGSTGGTKIIASGGLGVASIGTSGQYENLSYNGNSGALAANHYAKVTIVTAPVASGDTVKLQIKRTSSSQLYTLDCDWDETVLYVDGPGGFSALGTTDAVTDGQDVRLEYTGTHVRVLFDETEKLNVANTDLNALAAGTAALWIEGTVVEVDDFECGDV